MENALGKKENGEKKALPPRRTAIFRIARKRDADYLIAACYSTVHVQNLLLILAKEAGAHQLPASDFRQPRIVRALAAGTAGGQLHERVSAIREQMKELEIFKNFLAKSKELKEKNIHALCIKIAAAFKSAATKRKNGDLSAKEPRPKKLAYIQNFSVAVDQCAFSLRRKNVLGLNLRGKMRNFCLSHAAIAKACGSIAAVKAVEVVLQHGEAFVHLIYEPQLQQGSMPSERKNAGIDLGLRNLVSMFIEDEDSSSLVVKGAELCTFNARWKRKNAKLCEERDKILAKMNPLEKDSKRYAALLVGLRQEKSRLQRLHRRRRRYFNDAMSKLARRILEYLRQRQVSHLYLSRNLTRLKTEGPNIGKVQNQKFVNIPYAKLLDKLVALGSEYGISAEDQIDEAYTSKTSCISGDVCKVQELAATLGPRGKRSAADRQSLANACKGKRATKTRHLFTDSGSDRQVDADLNAAANHIKLAMGPGWDMSWLRRKLWKLCCPVVQKCESVFLDCRLGNLEAWPRGQKSEHSLFYATWPLAQR